MFACLSRLICLVTPSASRQKVIAPAIVAAEAFAEKMIAEMVEDSFSIGEQLEAWKHLNIYVGNHQPELALYERWVKAKVRQPGYEFYPLDIKDSNDRQQYYVVSPEDAGKPGFVEEGMKFTRIRREAKNVLEMKF